MTTYQVFKKIQNAPATWSQAARPPLGISLAAAGEVVSCARQTGDSLDTFSMSRCSWCGDSETIVSVCRDARPWTHCRGKTTVNDTLNGNREVRTGPQMPSHFYSSKHSLARCLSRRVRTHGLRPQHLTQSERVLPHRQRNGMVHEYIETKHSAQPAANVCRS